MFEGFQFVQGLPRDAIVPGTEVVDGSGKGVRRTRHVLTLEQPAQTILKRMNERGLEPIIAGDLPIAIAMLAVRDFDAVLVEAGSGLVLVKWIKSGVAASGAHAKAADEARRRHAQTPFFIFAHGSPEWAVVVRPPEHAYLEAGAGLQLVDALATLDVGRLLLRGPPLA